MNVKTLTKNDAIHVLNLLSMVLSLGVTCYFFDPVVFSSILKTTGDFLMSPVFIADKILGFFTSFTVSGNFVLMFFVNWACYASLLRHLYPILMIRPFKEEELRQWYLSKIIRKEM